MVQLLDDSLDEKVLEVLEVLDDQVVEVIVLAPRYHAVLVLATEELEQKYQATAARLGLA